MKSFFVRRPGILVTANSFTWAIITAALVVLAALPGCKPQSAVPDGPPIITPAPKSDTPEGKLKRVVDRLRTALREAQADPGSGVTSKRSATSRLIRPAEEGAPLKAEITIHTVVSMDQESARVMAGGKIDDEPTIEAIGEEEEEGPDPVVGPEAIAKNNEYELVYKDDRWQMATEFTPEQEIERICFEFALEN